VVIFARGVHTPVVWMGDDWRKDEITIDRNRFIHFFRKISIDSHEKIFFESFLNYAKLTNPIEYPCILNETKPSFINEKAKIFDKNSIILNSKVLLLIGQADDIDRIRLSLNFMEDDISKNTFKQFIENLTCFRQAQQLTEQLFEVRNEETVNAQPNYDISSDEMTVHVGDVDIPTR
jgi:hypothetical protein